MPEVIKRVDVSLNPQGFTARSGVLEMSVLRDKLLEKGGSWG